MSYKTIEVEYEPPGAIIRLNRPDKRNALSIEMRHEICKSPLEVLIREKALIMQSASKAVEEATSGEGQSFVEIIREGMKR